MATLIFWGLVTWLVVAPDKMSHTATRGLWGAARGWANPTYAATQAKAGRGKAGRSGAAQGSRWAGMLAGWRKGVRVARQKRANGKDVWSRGSYVAGRVWGGTSNLRAGVRRIPSYIAAWRADRAAKKGAPTVQGFVVDEPAEPAEEAEKASPNGETPDASGDEPPAASEVVQGEVVTSGTTDDLAADQAAGGAPAEGAGAPNNTTNTTEPAFAGGWKNLMSDMPIGELENLGSARAEMGAADPLAEMLGEAMAAAKAWGTGLPDRWSGAGWGTAAINDAIAMIVEGVDALGTAEPLMAGIDALKKALEEAGSLGEVAAEHQAEGDIGRFVDA